MSVACSSSLYKVSSIASFNYCKTHLSGSRTAPARGCHAIAVSATDALRSALSEAQALYKAAEGDRTKLAHDFMRYAYGACVSGTMALKAPDNEFEISHCVRTVRSWASRHELKFAWR